MKEKKYLRPTIIRSLARLRLPELQEHQRKKLWTINYVRPFIHHPDRQNWHRYNFFPIFQIWPFGYEMLLLIQLFVDMFRFDSFLFQVFRFSIKMFVFLILDIYFCFIFQITEITKNIDFSLGTSVSNLYKTIEIK